MLFFFIKQVHARNEVLMNKMRLRHTHFPMSFQNYLKSLIKSLGIYLSVLILGMVYLQRRSINLFLPDAPFFYPLFFWYFLRIEKGCNGKKMIKRNFYYLSDWLSVSIHTTNIRILQIGMDYIFKKKQTFMVPFHGWGSTASRLKPLRGGSLLFTIQFPEIPGTQSLSE